MQARRRTFVPKTPVENSNTEYLQTPDLPQVQDAWAYLAARRPREVRRTIELKFHRPSWAKVQELLWAHTQVTNLRSDILRLLGPYYAIECIQLMQWLRAEGSSSNRTQLLGEIIESCLRPPKRRLHRLYLRAQPFLSLWLTSETWLELLAHIVALLELAAAERLKERYAAESKKGRAIPREPKFSPPIRILYLRERYPVTPTLFSGACRETARDLLGWYSRITGSDVAVLDDDVPTDEGKPKAEARDRRTPEVYASWIAAMEPYQRAAQVVVPFGPDEGKTFAQVGPRGVRWLRARMTTRDQLEETLVHLEVLINPQAYKADEVRRAQHARHPWKTDVRSERAPRASRFAQHNLDSSQPRVRLAALERHELLRLHDEQLENLQYVDEFPALIISAELFFGGRGLKYPDITPILNAEEQATLYREYVRHLEWLQSPFPRNKQKDVTDFCAEDLEAVETTHTHEMEHAARALREPRLQPLAFSRSMRPPTSEGDDGDIHPAFALLYRKYDPSDTELDRRYRYLPQSQRRVKIQEARERGSVYEYVLAMVIHASTALSAPHNRNHFVLQLAEDFYYVDYPATRFVPPAGDAVSLMIFPLECGWGSDAALQPQSDQLLRKLIGERLAVQEKLYKKQKEPHLPLEQCLPSKGGLGSARITCARNQEGKYEFYVKIPLPRPVPAAQMPERVIGFHEHTEGYSYAVAGADGEVIAIGELPIPSHVQPASGEWYPRNYVYEVRKSMVALAVQHNAYIGVEDTSALTAQPSLSRAQNQRRGSRPSRTIISELTSAALLAGLLKPHEIRGVPLRCCGACGKKLATVSKAVVHRVTRTCPSCASPHLIIQRDDHRRLTCMWCGEMWRSSEPWFVCDSCHNQRVPAHNQATVVARLTLRRLVQLHEAAMKIDAERKAKVEEAAKID